MISCIALDDEPLALAVIEEFCKRTKEIHLLKTFTDTSAAARFIRKFPVDLIFLDIQMPSQNGIQFYTQHGAGKMVIFTTAYSEYAVEGFNISAIDYLLKPFSYQRFEQATKKAAEYYQYTHSSDNSNQHFLFVRAEYSLVKIPCAEIEYIETLDDYLKIHLDGKKPVLTKMNLKNMMNKLNPDEFIRIHRSYIIPMNKILSVRNKTVQLLHIELPIGLKHEDEFFRRFLKA